MTSNDKSWTLTASYEGAAAWNTIERHQRNMVAEPVRVGTMPSPDGILRGGQAMRVYSEDGKAVTLKSQGGGAGAKTGLYAIPMRVKEATSKGYVEIQRGGVCRHAEHQQ